MLFKCKNCEGNVIYSPSKGRMYCPHCDGVDSEERKDNEDGQVCPNCGAPLEIGKYNSTYKCEYCSSYIILDDRIEGEYRPRLLLPFKVDKNQAVAMLQEEFKKRIFTPNSFLAESTLEEMKGMYVPFWLYDYAVNCEYAGTGTKVRVWTSGDTEYTETSYYHIERNLDIKFDKLPVDASYEMPDDVMDLMEPYDYQQLEGFEEKYMSGFFGEIYNEDAEVLGDRARAKAENDTDIMLQETISGYATLRQENKTLDVRTEDAHFALLPVWRYTYKYQGKDYPFYLNGQNGKIIGSTPVAKKKVLVYGGTVFVLMWMALSFIAGILEVI